MNGIHSENIESGYSNLWLRRVIYHLLLVVFGFVLLFFITLMKADGTREFGIEPLLFVYTIFVTTFQLSRLIAAMFYEHSYKGSVIAKFPLASGKNFGGKYEPNVTFVVPCKNEESVIAETLENCFKMDYPKEKIEVIAINDGSTDRTAEEINRVRERYENLYFINWEANRGKKHAMAEGFRVAKGEIVIQLDSDSFIDPKTFRNIIEPFNNPEIGAVSVHTDPRNADKNFLTKMQAAYYFMSFRILKAAESTFLTVFCCSGCSSAYRKKIVLPRINEWLGETFLGLPVTWGDDRALTSRIIKAGYRTIYTDRVKALTIVPEKFRQLIKQQIRWKKSWFVNAIYNSKFIWKTQPFVAFSYYFPLIAVSVLSPIMAARAIFWLPTMHSALPLYHVAGLLLLAALFIAYYRFVAPENKYWMYFIPWTLFNLFVLSFLMFYAVVRINDRGWGTR